MVRLVEGMIDLIIMEEKEVEVCGITHWKSEIQDLLVDLYAQDHPDSQADTLAYLAQGSWSLG